MNEIKLSLKNALLIKKTILVEKERVYFSRKRFHPEMRIRQ